MATLISIIKRRRQAIETISNQLDTDVSQIRINPAVPYANDLKETLWLEAIAEALADKLSACQKDITSKQRKIKALNKDIDTLKADCCDNANS